MRPGSALSIIVSVVIAAGCSRSDHREFTLQGQVLSIAADRKEANVKHEAVKGLMPAMTMPYKVKDPAQFANLKAGDLITSTLVIVSNDAYLENVRKVGEAPLEQIASAPAPSAASGF
jgi:Cu/Ag efflux protein CusF